MKEFQRGERINKLINPGVNNDLQMYIDYLNYTDKNPASSYKFSMTADALGRK